MTYWPQHSATGTGTDLGSATESREATSSRASFSRFCGRAAVFLLIQISILILLISMHDASNESNYLAATIDKHTRLQSVDGARLILVGGSNVAFGCQSEMLEEGLDRPVVNMGLVGGLGIGFMLNEVADELRSGDDVILCFEYELYSGATDRNVLKQVIELYPPHITHLPANWAASILPRDGLTLLGGILRRSSLLDWTRSSGVNAPAASPKSTDAYRRDGFNRFGDMDAHHIMESTYHMEYISPSSSGGGMRGLSSATVPSVPDARVVQQLVRFIEVCRGKDVNVHVSFPPYPEPLYPSIAETLRKLEHSLDTISGWNILNSPQEELHPISEFFDTGYHLTAEGAKSRTLRLLEAFSDE